MSKNKNKKLIENSKTSQAHLRYFKIAPRKIRLVADLVKKMPVNSAIKQLMFSRKKSAPALLKLLKSAMSNAKIKLRLEPENMYIKEFKVDEAPVFKRFMPRARGRASAIRKRRSHISIILGELKSKNHKLKAEK